MRVGDEASANAHQCQWSDFHISCLWRYVPKTARSGGMQISQRHKPTKNLGDEKCCTQFIIQSQRPQILVTQKNKRLQVISHLVQSNQAVVLLVDVQILDQPLSQAISKCPDLFLQLLSMLVCEHAHAVFHDNVRSTHAPAITCQQNGPAASVGVSKE